jgi:hypothetical protein
MKKILIVLSVLIIAVLVFLFFWGGGRKAITDFFTENNDFGSFFDIDPQSQNDFALPPDIATSTPVAPGPYAAPVLRQISFEPVSGFTFYATSSTSTRIVNNPETGDFVQEFLATSTAIRFQERATGHIYDVFEFLETPQKTSNITVQKVYRSLFTNDRNEFFAQMPTFNNEQIKTTLTRIIPARPETATASSTEQTLEQRGISSVINDATYLPDTNKLVYSIKKETGSEIYASNPDRTSETLVTIVPFKEFQIEPLDGGRVLLQTNATASAPGYTYSLSLSTGTLTKVLGDISGLLIKPNQDLTYYLYSESNQNRPIVRAAEVSSGLIRQIGIHTIPEKCVFSKINKAEAYCFGSLLYTPAVYPDDWYKGKVFNDEDLYKVNLANGVIESVYLFGEDLQFDVINPMLTANDEGIIFQNKYDLTLWAIDLAALNNEFN